MTFEEEVLKIMIRHGFSSAVVLGNSVTYNSNEHRGNNHTLLKDLRHKFGIVYVGYQFNDSIKHNKMLLIFAKIK
jgi:hypothetical protein